MMTSGTTEISSRNAAVGSLADIVGFCLAAGSIIAACVICLRSQPAISVHTPEILAFASALVLLPVRQKTQLDTLQKIVVFYLVATVLNQLTSQYFQVSFPNGTANVSYTVIIMIPFALAAILARQRLLSFSESMDKEILSCWYVALAVIVGHMIVLALILRKFYGYGYEHDVSVLGNLCLYVLLFLLTWRRFDSVPFRRVVGVVLLLFYVAVIIGKRFA